jgi:CBS domain-containing protein
VDATDPTSRTISREDAAEKTVGDVMIQRPKTLPSDALVADVRQAFARPGVRTVLLAQDGAFVGAIEREGLPADAHENEPARAYVQPEPLTVTPATAMIDAIELLENRGEPRLIVLDDDGVTLRGLLCANGNATGFCIR